MTQSSIRKHISQMMSWEEDFCMDQVRNKEWIFSGHVMVRIEERGGTVADILETIGYGELIEYHKRNNKSRLLLRGRKAIHNWVPCVVVELSSKKIITVYWNHVKDHHRTIDMSRYNNLLDVVESIKGEVR